MKAFKTLTVSCAVFLITASPVFTQKVYAVNADGFHSFETEEYYKENATKFTTKDWLNDFVLKQSKFSQADIKDLQGLHYYLRLDPSINVNGIKSYVDPSNPDNVNRVIELMPESKFEEMFPKSKTGPCSYSNFLKAVAFLPGLFSDYKDFDKTGVPKTDEMGKPDLIAQKILAAIMANAVQETSNSGQGDKPTLQEKVPGAFSVLKEPETDAYNSISMGPFAPGCPWAGVAEGNLYFGRGVHQITYGMTYANISLFLYGDLRLVKYPNLLASDTILPWITTLVYFVLPQSQYPSIAEVFDGQWNRQLKNLNVDATWKEKYMKEFPVCVLLINGGIECGQASMKNDAETKLANNNTKIRGEGYHRFVEEIEVNGKFLFDPNGGPKITGTLNGEEVLNACHSISQMDTAPESKGLYQGLSWYRKFFLTPEGDPANYYTDYMVFGGEGISTLLSKSLATGETPDNQTSNTEENQTSKTVAETPDNPIGNNESVETQPETEGGINEWKADTYHGGDIVTLDGVQYRAQWDANPDQVPGASVENPWDSPWVKIN